MALNALLLGIAALLPAAPQPAAPFPKIITDAPTITDVAPGVRYGDYEIRTADGPLSVHVLAIDLRDPNVRIGTALSGERLVSGGETVSSMALRTGAVAGVNGDYFDINQTNQPLNIFIENSRLIRVPMQRWAIAFDSGKAPRFAEFTLTETATLPQGNIPLKTMNDWPPPGGGAVFITPQYGPLRAIENVTEIALQPLSGTPPFADYRVTAIADNTQTQPAGYYLALGTNAYGSVPLPNAGDDVSIDATATPPLDGIVSAVGGGPLLVKDGLWYADPDGPSKGEFATHMPATSVGVTRDGILMMFEIDGRQPALSIGVLQPQLASLMIAFGVVTGMQFDGGGSSTLVARLPGDQNARVQNSPSDGLERRVANSLLVYSDASTGPPARIYALPQAARAMPGAAVQMKIAITDAGGHRADCDCSIRMRVTPGSAGRMDGDVFIAGARAGDAAVHVDAGELHTDVPVHVLTSAAYAQILPQQPALRAGESVQLQARAFDGHGYPIALPQDLHWTASSGRIDRSGFFVAGAHDASVDVSLGATHVSQTVTVGEHTIALPLARYAQFATAPRSNAGGIDKERPCSACLTLHYDFTSDERAAYANASIPLPERVLAISADVLGDGNGETLRLAVNNAINERFLYTVARVDWQGWRHVEFRFPAALPQPITFKSMYVINRVGPAAPVQSAGSIALRDVRVILAGSGQTAPK